MNTPDDLVEEMTRDLRAHARSNASAIQTAAEMGWLSTYTRAVALAHVQDAITALMVTRDALQNASVKAPARPSKPALRLVGGTQA